MPSENALVYSLHLYRAAHLTVRHCRGRVPFKFKFGWEPHCFANGTTFDGSRCDYKVCGFNNSFNSATNFAPEKDGSLGPFSTWTDLANHAGESRIYGGIHPQSGNVGGQLLGARIGNVVYSELCNNYIGPAGCAAGFRSATASALAPALAMLVAFAFAALALL